MADLMPPAKDPLEVVRGDTFETVYQFGDLSNLAAGLATLTPPQVSAVIEPGYGGPVGERVPLTVTVDAGVGPNEHVVTLSLTDEETATLTGRRYVWSLRVTDTPGDADDKTYTLLKGDVTVVPTAHAQTA